MKLSLVRTAGWAAVCILILAGVSCDALNPAFVAQLGGDAGTAGPAPTGSIVLLVNNQTGRRVLVDYQLEITQAGGGQIAQTGSTPVPAAGYWAWTFDCDTVAVSLTSLSFLGTATQPGDDTVTAVIPLAVSRFSRPALQCGSVIFLNIPLIGSPTADLLP